MQQGRPGKAHGAAASLPCQICNLHACCVSAGFNPLTHVHPVLLLPPLLLRATGKVYRSNGNGGFYYVTPDNELFTFLDGNVVGPIELDGLSNLTDGNPTTQRRRLHQTEEITIDSCGTDGSTVFIVLEGG